MQQIAALEALAGTPGFYRNPAFAKQQLQDLHALRYWRDEWDAADVAIQNLLEKAELDPFLAAKAGDEMQSADAQLARIEEIARYAGPQDHLPAILMVNAQKRFADAFSGQLIRALMAQGLNCEVLQEDEWRVLIELQGPFAFGKSKHLAGNSQVLNTTFHCTEPPVLLDFETIVFPLLVNDEEYALPENDLHWDHCRPSYPNFYKGNPIRLKHLPSQRAIQIDLRESTNWNRRKALQILRSWLQHKPLNT